VVETLFADGLHVEFNEFFPWLHIAMTAVTLETTFTPTLFQRSDYLRLYDLATVCTGVSKHFVVMVLAVRSSVIGSDKVRIVHEGLLAVRTDEVLRMPRLNIINMHYARFNFDS
jgi:hypothetical protein